MQFPESLLPSRRPLLTGMVLGLLSLGSGPAQAVPFASFSDHGSMNSVVFKNLPAPPAARPYAANSTVTASGLVDFNFEGFPNLAPALLATQSALLNYTFTTTTGASGTAIPPIGTIDSQPVDHGFTLSFTRTTPYTPAGHPTLHLTNLLTASLSAQPGETTTAEMSGFAGASSVHLDSDDSYAVVNFSSDFLDFSESIDHSMALSYTLQTLQYLGVGAKFLTAYDKTSGGTGSAATCPGTVITSTQLCNYRGFKATESGNFGSTPLPKPLFTVPEPASLGVLGVGLFALAAIRRRQAA